MNTGVMLTIDEFNHIKLKLERIEELLSDKSSNQSSIWVSTKEAMEIMGVGETTLWNYRKQGIISASKINKKLYFNRNDLNRVIESANLIKK